MKRRDLLKTLGMGALAAPLASKLSAAQAPLQRPNVILLITDDQGYGDLSCHGNPVLKTPNLDRLHDESVRLTDFHVSPTCSPTRASLLTGRYCNRTGVWHTIMGRSLLRRDEVTMADVFAANGYRTGIFGKWHLGDNFPFRPQDRGFQEVLVHRGGGIGQGSDWWGNDYFDDTYFRNGRPEKFEGYCTDVWFREAAKFIETRREQPFFCYLATNAPHAPHRIDRRYSEPFRGQAEEELSRFYGMVANIDENTGRLMGMLDERGLRGNTIVVFMTDNGSEYGEGRTRNAAGMRSNKGSPYEGGHRVPFFIRWPDGGLHGGRDIGRLTAHIDVLPTLIDLCGLIPPPGVVFDGKSLKPLLAGSAADWPDRILVTDSQRVDHPVPWRRSAVMGETWRLVNRDELYDIQADPHQDRNVAMANPDVVGNMRKAYESWWKDVSKRFNEYCEIVIGAREENPTCLMSHDVHGQVVWNHGQVSRGARSDGFWAVEAAQDGLYEFALRRWPPELDQPITAAVPVDQDEPAGSGITATEARLKIAGFDETKPVPAGAAEVKFTLPLKSGKTRLQAWFVNGLGNGITHGVYYVCVKRLS